MKTNILFRNIAVVMIFISNLLAADDYSGYTILNPPEVYIFEFSTNSDSELTNIETIASTLITTVGESNFVVSGHSIASHHNFNKTNGDLNLERVLEASNYPTSTDILIVGELNYLPDSYVRLDVWVINAKSQGFISTRDFTVREAEFNTLLISLSSYTKSVLSEYLKPFTGFLELRCDDCIDYERIYFRPTRYKSGGTEKKSSDEDLQRLSFIEDSEDRIQAQWEFLPGVYRIQARRTDQEAFFQTEFSVKAEQTTVVEISCEKPEFTPPPIKYTDLTIKNIYDNFVVKLQPISVDGLEQDIYIVNYDGRLQVRSNGPVSFKINKTDVEIKQLSRGQYSIIAYKNPQSAEVFPGKYEYNIGINYKRDIELIEGEESIAIVRPREVSGKEIILYFNPFPESNDEIYSVFLDENLISEVSNVGELKLSGIKSNSAKIMIERENYAAFSKEILMTGKPKEYVFVDLTIK